MESQAILFFLFCLIIFSQSFTKKEHFSNFVWLKEEIKIIRSKRRSNSPGCHPVLYNPGVLQNHSAVCWQLVQCLGWELQNIFVPVNWMAGHTNNPPFILFICTLTMLFSLPSSFCFSVKNSNHFTMYLAYFIASMQISLSVNISFDQWGNWGTKTQSNLLSVIDK